jgi:hypothetical protein
MAQFISETFAKLEMADRAVDEVIALGYPRDQISVIMDHDTRERFANDPPPGERQGVNVAKGAAAGGAIGGTIGAIVAGLGATGTITATIATGGLAAPLSSRFVGGSSPSTVIGDPRKPRGCAVLIVKSRADAIGCDVDDVPPITSGERRSQLVLTNGMRPRIGALVTKAQNVESSTGLHHGREIRHVRGSLVAIERVEESAIQDRIETASERCQVERVGHIKSSVDATVGRLRPGHRDRRLGNVDTENRKAKRGDEQRILTAAASSIEHVARESAFGCQTHDRRLRLADIPRRGTIVIRRVPGQPRHPLVTGWNSTTERIGQTRYFFRDVAGAFFKFFFRFVWLCLIAARTSAFKARSSIVSFSKMLMTRRALPSKPALNSLSGSGRLAP